MIPGWIEVKRHEMNPQYNPNGAWNAQNNPYWLEIPTGEQECPDCHYRTDVRDAVGIHTCPELTDCNGEKITIGDRVVAFVHSRLRICEITKYKKETGNVGMDELNPKENQSQGRFNVSRTSRIMRYPDEQVNS